MSKYGVFSGPYFPVFGLNTEIYGVNLLIQSEYRKIWTRKNSAFGYFFRSEYYTKWLRLVLWSNVSCSHFFQDWPFVSLLVPQYTNCIYFSSGVHHHIPTVIDIRYYLYDSSPPPSWTKFIKIDMRICIYRVHIFKRSFINPISLSQSKY